MCVPQSEKGLVVVSLRCQHERVFVYIDAYVFLPNETRNVHTSSLKIIWQYLHLIWVNVKIIMPGMDCMYTHFVVCLVSRVSLKRIDRHFWWIGVGTGLRLPYFLPSSQQCIQSLCCLARFNPVLFLFQIQATVAHRGNDNILFYFTILCSLPIFCVTIVVKIVFRIAFYNSTIFSSFLHQHVFLCVFVCTILLQSKFLVCLNLFGN